MTKLRTVGLVVAVLVFLAILMLFPLAALAQQTDRGSPSAKSSMPRQAGAPSQTWQDPAPPGLTSAQALRNKKEGAKTTNVASVSFLPAVTYNTAADGYPASLEVADVNGDGKPDLVVASGVAGCCGASSFGVLLGNGDGTFQPEIVSYLSGVDPDKMLGVADVDGDGRPDLIIATCCESNGDGAIAVLLGNGDGTFQPPAYYDSGGKSYGSIAVADINGDGKPDIVAINANRSDNSTVGVLLGNGDGTFQPAITSASPDDPMCLTIADVNNDGKPDALICSEASVAVLLGNGDGTFQSFTNSNFPTNFCTSSVAAADLSGNGFLDMVTANPAPPYCTLQGDAGVLMGDGTGMFQPEVDYLAITGTLVGRIAVADLNGDGKADAIVTSGAGPFAGAEGVTVAVLLGNGDGTLQAPTLFNTGGSCPYAVVAADLNGDGKPDLAVANVCSNTLGVLLNNTNALTTASTLASSVNPVPVNQYVTYTASVTSQYGTATGTVKFQDKGMTIAAARVSNNQATFTTKYGAAGVQVMTATYSGDLNNQGSTSSTFMEDVGKVPYVSKTTVATSGSPSLYGQPVTFTGTVTSALGAIPDGETVTFYADSKEIGTGTTNGGVATFTASSLPAKTYTIRATYSGDSTFRWSAGKVTQVVTPYSTTTTLTSSLNPSTYGQTVTWTATVTSNGGPVPTGKAKFAGVGGVATLSGGVARMNKTWLNAATYAITAEYGGDDASAPSDSAALNQVVNPAATTTTVTSSANPSSQGQSVTFRATVTTSTGVNSAGTVTFTAGGTTLGTATLSANVASVSTSALPAGTTVVQATYNGETDFTGSSGTVTQTVNP